MQSCTLDYVCLDLSDKVVLQRPENCMSKQQLVISQNTVNSRLVETPLLRALAITDKIQIPGESYGGLTEISLGTQTYFRLSRFSPPKNNVCVSERQNDFHDVAAFVFSLANQIT